MNRVSHKLLRKVASREEIPLSEALTVGAGVVGDHREQYPLALLIEDDYLGCSLNHRPPDGAERQREYSQAIGFHIFTLPKKEDGSREYQGIISRGSVDPQKERVFLKAKGALYLEERDQRQSERLFTLFMIFASAVAASLITRLFE